MKYLLPPVLFIFCIASMLLLHFLIPIRDFMFGIYILPGVVIMLLGGGLTLSGVKIFKRKGTTEMTFDEPGVLVTEGIYKITRNPMYLGFSFILLGLAIVLGSISPLFVVLGFFIITNLWYIRFEEKMLEKKFGEAYLAYKAHVRRWI
ncbi:Protein-S-isoprenylcysteine O-methyltransferase Ste14 [Evansella caseinilytica]|uniref:Protein-S-isoprenylcysteine O-methyltransferase Ste14 n=1 Tax=Evansella caseinilytica TaxID=1503961 RepID=A0A1H3H438_9BACI|nr:isoprenylcysteine carboxylmethyltransferase family protein [Evansella caseinilytica]SDY10343.1 Protein-S-isoprenylcysteine O-methyltransferase Ste14 [Evansella caseinilytica]